MGVRASYTPADDVQAVIAVHGAMASEALAARDLLAEQGIRAGVLLTEYIRPYGKLADEILPLLPAGVPVVFAEEEIRAGGFGMMLSDALHRHPRFDGRELSVVAVEDNFVIQERDEPIRRSAEVDAEAIANRVAALLGRV